MQHQKIEINICSSKEEVDSQSRNSRSNKMRANVRLKLQA
jgi:hypothetical protein